MDLGIYTDKTLDIPTPSEVLTELGLYIHLCINKEAREKIIAHAAKIRTPAWSNVWACHPTTCLPITIYPTTTEEMLRDHALCRFKILVRNGKIHF